MSEQLTLTPHLTPAEAHIIDVLRDGREHSALEFKRGRHGVFIDSVSQRIGALKRKGFDIIGGGKGGHDVATYRLVKS